MDGEKFLKFNDGGQAFPVVGEGCGNPHYHISGMTLRDWFAGQAVSGLSVGLVGELTIGGRSEVSAYAHGPCDKVLADRAYAVADALLAARAATTPPGGSP